MLAMSATSIRLLMAGNWRTVQRMVWALVVLLLVVAPALDLGWAEPTLSRGGHCQLHANPGVALERTAPIIVLAAELLLPFESLARVPFIASTIFIPPRI